MKRPGVRTLALLGIVAAGLVAVVAAAAWHNLSVARTSLVDARAVLDRIAADPTSLTDHDGRQRAEGQLRTAMASIDRAGREVHDSLALRLAFLPGLSRQRSGVRQLIADARTGAVAGGTLLEHADALAARGRLSNGAVDVPTLDQLRTEVSAAGRSFAGLHRSPKGLWGSLAAARRQLDDVSSRTADRLASAADSLGAAATFLGRGGERRYLIAVQNNAEMRDQGLITSYAVASFDHGRLHIDKAGHINELSLRQPVEAPISNETQAMFGGLAPRQLWQGVNATADFSWSARTMSAMYTAATGGRVDGVIGLDVPALQALLTVTGPVQAAGLPRVLDSSDVASILLHDLYAAAPRNGDQPQRYELIGQVTQAVIEQLTTGDHDLVSLGHALANVAAGRHLLLWSADAGEEAVFTRSGAGGQLNVVSPDRTIHVDVQNATATKLDYYVHPRVRMNVILTKLGTAVVRTTVSVVNDAPVRAAPSYQLGPDDLNSHVPGEYVSRIYYWGPAGALQEDSIAESGLQLNQIPVTVEPGQQAAVTFETVIAHAVRNGVLSLRLVPQARLQPDQLDVHLDAPGWRLGGAGRDLSLAWDRTIQLAWSCQPS